MKKIEIPKDERKPRGRFPRKDYLKLQKLNFEVLGRGIAEDYYNAEPDTFPAFAKKLNARMRLFEENQNRLVAEMKQDFERRKKK